METIYTFIGMFNEMSPYLLLGFLVAGLLYAFVPPSFYGRHLSHRGALAVLKAALIGVPLPLCSCGVLPTAVSLRRNGASRAATTSFLIATPQTGVDSIAATYSLLGPAFAIIRPVAALITAFVGGIVVGNTEKCTDDTSKTKLDAPELPKNLSFWQRCVSALHYGFVEMVQNIGKWLLLGLVIATLITVFVPDDFFTFFDEYPLLAMIVVVIVAIPMYVCSTGSIPIALSLMLKGLSPGAAFVLLMAGPAANFASMLIVDRTLGRHTAIAYISTIVVGSILIGLSIDYLMPSRWFTSALTQAAASGVGCCHHFKWEVFPTICSAVLVCMLIYAFLSMKLSHRHQRCCKEQRDTTLTIQVGGMTCNHCATLVAKSLQSVEGVDSVSVNLDKGVAEIEGNPQMDKIRKALSDSGFSLIDQAKK